MFFLSDLCFTDILSAPIAIGVSALSPDSYRDSGKS